MKFAAELVQRLGGAANVTDLEPCVNRVRVQVANPALVDVPGLKSMGAHGVVISGWVVQVVISADTCQVAGAARRLLAPPAAARKRLAAA
ncbi:MAG: PTS transporter subunit EIIB [Bifidobacteriaceae bacterium]|nr:PTS transporter subunit EIIB [Bifidobacteriaceae bacterium]